MGMKTKLENIFPEKHTDFVKITLTVTCKVEKNGCGQLKFDVRHKVTEVKRKLLFRKLIKGKGFNKNSKTNKEQLEKSQRRKRQGKQRRARNRRKLLQSGRRS